MFKPYQLTRVPRTFPWLLGTALCAHACVSELGDLNPAVKPGPTTSGTTAESDDNEPSGELSTTSASPNSHEQTSADAGVTPNTDPEDSADAGSPDDPSTTSPSSTTDTFDAEVTSTAGSNTATADDTTATDDTATTTTSEPTSEASTTTDDNSSSDDSNGDTLTFFTPDAGLLVWFDADHTASFDVESGTVETWLDRSGSAFNLTQTASANRPERVSAALASRSVVRFDGVDDSLVAAQALQNRAFEVLLVWRSAVAPSLTKSSLLVNGRNFELNYSHTAVAAANAVSVCVGVGCINNSGWHNARFTPSPQAQVAYLWNPIFAETGTDLLARVWGGSAITQSAPDDTPVLPSAPLLMGNCAEGSCPFNGDIAELVIFDRALTEPERTQAESYLAAKWSLM